MRYANPILPGFHPDPSVCRVGDWFYMVTSTFQFFPGIPVRRSRDLCDWEIVGFGIDRFSGIDLRRAGPSRGLFAPTIRHDGRGFFITCTEVDGLGNFFLRADEAEGPWSDPIPLAVGGIDPSLFFEGETAYLCSNGSAEDGDGISLCVIDRESGAVLDGPRRICPGSGGRWPEGPHLYKLGGTYYLIISEGGTEYGHMVSAFRSHSPWGPYEACPRNPFLSHRDAGAEAVQCVGHADIVEDGAGSWWLFCLGTRPLGPLLHNLGRETFLAPLAWDRDGWPIAGPIRLQMEGPLPSPPGHGPARTLTWVDDFAAPRLDPAWTSARSRPEGAHVRALGDAGGLELAGAGVGLSESLGAPALLCRPQEALECVFEALVDFEPRAEGDEAGICAYYDERYHYEAAVARRSGSRVLLLRRRVHDLELESTPIPVPDSGTILLRLAADREAYAFSFACAGASTCSNAGAGAGRSGRLGSGSAAGLCTEGTMSMSFTG
ncbi:MAG: glycoside hydrolase family 43 protein, partial [Spirochaetaceae bacterium]|nr:glycoside hydrolase family 43 protein [Spirochaetaceae bacterium]